MWIHSAIHEILADKAFTATDGLISQSFVVAFVHLTYMRIALIWGFLVQLSLWKLVYWLWRYKLNEVCNTNKNAWSTAFVEILEHLWEPLNVLMDTNNSISITNLENAVSALTTAIICTNEQVAKKYNPNPTAKLWWNKTLTEIAAYIWQLQELQCEHLKIPGFRDLDLDRDIKRICNLFKRQVQYAKGMWANETPEKATADEV